LLILSAWCWLALVTFGRGLAGACTYVRSWGLHAVQGPLLELWVGWCGVACLLAMLPAMGLWEASMRYPGDAVGALVMLGALAAFWLLRSADAARRRSLQLATRVVLVALGLHSCIVGALSGFDTYGAQFRGRNPVLYEQLQETLSFCGNDT
jgi:hypothetical protein